MDFEAIKKSAAAYGPDMTRFLRDMIAIPSESCEEKGVVMRIKEEMEKLGFDKVEIDALGNVIGWMGTGEKIIAIDSHIDTVGIGNRENWTHDPYAGYEDDKIIYGRGGSDQEGGMAAAAYGVKIMKDLDLIPEGYKIMVVGSVQEEDCDGMCWQSIVNEYFNGPEDARSKIEFVISTEPTDGGIYRGHRGRMEIRVDMHGVSCHGSAPERGDNAIHKMAEVLLNVRDLNENDAGDDKEVKRYRSAFVTPTHQDYWDELWEEFKASVGEFNGYEARQVMDMRVNVLMNDRAQMDDLHKYPGSLTLSQIVEPEGWANAPEGAKEFTWFQVMGHLPKPCLILKNEEGKYDRIAIYASKDAPEPIRVVKEGEFAVNVPDFMPLPTGQLENVIRNMRILEIAEDGSSLRVWYSTAFSADDKRVWWPGWVFDECVGKFGPPVPTGMISNDYKIMRDCNTVQWHIAGKWQADCINHMIEEHGVEVVFSHYHLVDLSGHTYMNVLKDRYDSRYSEEEIYQLAVGTYEACDEYVGEFLHLLDEGWTIFLFSDHGLVCRTGDFDPLIGDNYNVNVGVLRHLGYTVMKKDEYGHDTPDIDWEKTRAVQTGSNAIFVNLKGRDRFGIVDPEEKWELEEQIISDLYSYRDPFTNHRVVALALHKKDAVLLGLGGSRCADITCFVHDDYSCGHGNGLSTAQGYNDTSLSPIFIAAGPGIKKGFTTDRVIREVDVAPTVSMLLGVNVPAECEGAPVYQILSESL